MNIRESISSIELSLRTLAERVGSMEKKLTIWNLGLVASTTAVVNLIFTFLRIGD